MPSPEAQVTENRVDMGAEETGTLGPPRQKSWLVRHFSLLLRKDRQAQKAGQLFSGLLALNVAFLGGAFICSMIFNNVAVTLGDVWILLAVLKVLSLLWLLYYMAGTTRQPHAVLYRDPHAGPIWVRGECRLLVDGEGWGGNSGPRAGANTCLAWPGSLVLFGSCTICLNIFRMGYDVSHSHCKSELELMFPAIEIVFMGVQVTGLTHSHATKDTPYPPRPHMHPRHLYQNSHKGNASVPQGVGTHTIAPTNAHLRVPTSTHMDLRSLTSAHTPSLQRKTARITSAYTYLHMSK
jgi:hypothetical protein